MKYKLTAKVYVCEIWPVDSLVILAIRDHITGLKVSDERKPANYQSSPLALTGQTVTLWVVERVTRSFTNIGMMPLS